jgi:hypothetical protein
MCYLTINLPSLSLDKNDLWRDSGQVSGVRIQQNSLLWLVKNDHVTQCRSAESNSQAISRLATVFFLWIKGFSFQTIVSQFPEIVKQLTCFSRQFKFNDKVLCYDRANTITWLDSGCRSAAGNFYAIVPTLRKNVFNVVLILKGFPIQNHCLAVAEGCQKAMTKRSSTPNFKRNRRSMFLNHSLWWLFICCWVTKHLPFYTNEQEVLTSVTESPLLQRCACECIQFPGNSKKQKFKLLRLFAQLVEHRSAV